MKTPFTLPKGIRASILNALGGALAAGLLAGCQFPSPRQFDPRPLASTVTNMQVVVITNRITPDLLQAPTNLFTLGPGDLIEVELVDDLTSRSLLSVGPDGKIYFNLLPGIDVWGLTLSQAKELLEQKLSTYMREKPQIVITLRDMESKKMWLLGRFVAPGVYPMTNSVTLLEAIYSAGGPLNASSSPEATKDFSTYGADDNLADLRHSFVLRNGNPLPVDFPRLFKGDLTQNIYIQPDDFIYLPPATATRIHVIGAVTLPGKQPYVRNMTLSAAIAAAGGVAYSSYERQTAIVRGSLQQPRIAIVNFRDIVRGKAGDVLLEPGDIVYVPLEPYRLLTHYLNVITRTFVSSVAINEGARAAINNPTTTTGILIPYGSTTTTTTTGTIVK